MLNRLLSIAAVVSFFLLSAGPAASDLAFAPSVGVEYRYVGGTWVQNDTQTKLNPSIIMGGAVDVDAIAVGGHRIGLSIAYLADLGAEPEGTAQINVLSKRQQTDFMLVYRYHWDYVCLSASAGGSMGIHSVTTRIYSLGPPSSSANGQSYVFDDKTLAREDKSVGIVWGPAIGTEVGLDLGRLALRRLGRFDNFLFVTLAGQYSFRDQKHELLIWGAISVFPMELKRNAK